MRFFLLISNLQKSILTWHVTLWFDFIYSMFYCVIMMCIHWYKGYGGLLYPPSVWVFEFLGLLMLTIVQMVRIYIGFSANRTENSADTCNFIFLTFLSIGVILYYSYLTTYVLMIEILLSIVILAMCLIEFLLGIIAFRRFKV